MAALSEDRLLVEDDDAALRRHALWGLGVLVLLAVLVICLTLFFAGTPGSRHGQRIELGIPTGPAVSAPASGTASPPSGRTGSSPARSPSATPSAHRRTSSSAPAPTTSAPPSTRRRGSRPAAGGGPCPGTAACALAGDGGAAVALDAIRHQRGAPDAEVSVTAAAQRCAASGGAQCPGQYAVQTGTAQDGRAAIAALAASDGNAWLFTAQTTALQAGWAYLPGLHQYVLALLAG